MSAVVGLVLYLGGIAVLVVLALLVITWDVDRTSADADLSNGSGRPFDLW